MATPYIARLLLRVEAIYVYSGMQHAKVQCTVEEHETRTKEPGNQHAWKT